MYASGYDMLCLSPAYLVKMSNPKPRLENLKPFKPKGDKPFSKSYAVRWPEDIWQRLEQIPDKSEFIRRAVRRELMAQSPDELAPGSPVTVGDTKPGTGDVATSPSVSKRGRKTKGEIHE